MSKRDPALLLEDVTVSIEKIERYIYSLTIDGFKADDKTVDAVVRNLEIIGEAVRQIPSEFKEKNNNITWNQIAGLRNRIVHDYFGLDLEMIWHIVTFDLPELKKKIREIAP
ncbi:MAG: hypothetical protein C0399_01830 [Syntrophus sp. (in: bacteria)]|nr:hypothetical protein [Syntrophus sp. (in: bacteria)]